MTRRPTDEALQTAATDLAALVALLDLLDEELTRSVSIPLQHAMTGVLRLAVTARDDAEAALA